MERYFLEALPFLPLLYLAAMPEKAPPSGPAWAAASA
jgi:hypothetical protein